MRIKCTKNQENNDLILNSKFPAVSLQNKSKRPFLIESTKKLSSKLQNDNTKENIPCLINDDQKIFYNPKENHQFLSEILSML